MISIHCQRLAVLVLSLVALTRGAGAQRPPGGDSGSVVRVRTVRAVEQGLESRNTARGAGLLIRRQGGRQRADLLTRIEDSSGTAWIDLSEAPQRMVLHDQSSRTSIAMRFADLRSVFTTLLHARIDSASTEAEVLGDGPTILGHATRRVRYRQRLRMEARRGSVSQTTRVVSETEALVAPDVPESWGGGSALSLTAGNASALIEQIFGAGSGTVVVQDGATVPTGLALRSVTRTRTEVSGNGAILGPVSSSVTVDSVEVLSIERRMLPAALFAQPEGFQTKDFGEELQGLVTSLDALSTSLERLGKNAKGGGSQKPWKPTKPAKAPKP